MYEYDVQIEQKHHNLCKLQQHPRTFKQFQTHKTPGLQLEFRLKFQDPKDMGE